MKQHVWGAQGEGPQSWDANSTISVVSAASTLSCGMASSVEAEVETWMIMQYCDKGSLQVRRHRSFGFQVQAGAPEGDVDTLGVLGQGVQPISNGETLLCWV